METFAWDLSLGNFRLIGFVWDPSFGNLSLELSLWNFRFGTRAQELSLRNVSLETFVLGNFAWEFSLQSFNEDLSLAIFRDLSLGNARRACAGRLGLSLGIVCLGTLPRDISL